MRFSALVENLKVLGILDRKSGGEAGGDFTPPAKGFGGNSPKLWDFTPERRKTPTPLPPNLQNPKSCLFLTLPCPSWGGIKGLSTPSKPSNHPKKNPSLLAPLWGSPQCLPVWPHSPPRTESPCVVPAPNSCPPPLISLYFSFLWGFLQGSPAPR